ncbi:autotransporter/adhesin [Mannheimia varigena USDA-ARS-USMARC-1388]|uniref:YadA-like family protein n=1 Tax=Mannheimia varigena TaxID=85404 RepID=UPI0003E373DC|nr:YadA-like family protein [Mannheimia varigena]AHG78830.1 autotransporter/adhesin [Mannheimia varigena USDA-ARS-USMARC-1388]
MNKIFKVIFNRTTQKMEVVSELAKSQGKAASSTDERGSISPLVDGLKGSILVGGTALLMISAMPAEAVISVTGNYEGYTTGKTIYKIGDTYAYNYYNPGSLSYDNPSATDTTGNGKRYDETLHIEGIAIGNNTTIQSRQSSSAYNNGIAIGDHSQSIGGLSIAIGGLSKATDIGAVALGTSSYASGFNSFAAMRQSAAKADYAAAIGSSSWANATASFAIGASATALGERSFAIGSGVPQSLNENTGEARRSIYDGNNNTLATGTDAFSIGTKAKTNGNSSFAIGTNANAGGFITETSNIAELGTVTNADKTKVANDAFALGTNTRALSDDTVAFSTNATAQGDGAIAFGVDSKANGTGAIAFGNISNATGANAISIGWNATSHAEKVISIGTNSTVTKEGGMAIGDTAKSTGENATTVGYNSSVNAKDATVMGANATVTTTGLGGTAFGFNSSVSGLYGTAIAYNSKASGENALAVGTNSNVSGNNSGAFGQSNTVTGQDTFVLGSNVNVDTNGSVILGNSSTASTAQAVANKVINGVTYNFAGHDAVVAGDYVSVGSDANERQIKFVAPGEISNTSTDAINGSQLYAVMTEGSWTVKASGSNKDSKVNFGDVVDFKSSDKSVTITPTFGDKDNSLDFTVNVDGTTITRDATGKLSAVAAKVEKGTNIASVDAKKDATGITTYTINADGVTVSNATSSVEYLTVTAGAKDPITNKTNYEVKLTDKALTEFKKDDDTKTGVIKDTSGYISVTEHTGNDQKKREGDDRTYIVGLSEKAITDFTKDTSATVKEGSSYVTVTSTTNSTNANVIDYTVDVSESTKNTITTNTNNIATNTQNIANNTAEINKGFGLQAQDGKNVNKKLGEFVEVVGGNSNINTTVEDSKVKVNLSNTLDLTDAGSVTIGGTKVNKDGITINNGPSVTTTGINAGNTVITNVSNGTISSDSKEAVNGSQLYATNQNVTNITNKVNQGFNIDADNRGDNLTAADNVQLGETVKYTSSDNNIITTVTNNTIDFALNSTLAIGGKDGKPGIGLDGTNGTIGLTGPAGKDGKSATANITVKNGQPGVDGKDGETKTRIVYDTPNGEEEVATLNDGLKFGANTGDVHNAKLNTQVNVKGAEGNTEWNKFDEGKNIMTQINGNNITVALAKDVNLTESGSVTIGGTTINKDGITINNGPKITNKDGSVNVANQDGTPTKITNVKEGDVTNTSTDAVNGSQLYTVQEIANAGWNLTINEGNNSSNVKPKETVDLNNKDGNIQITKEAHNVTFALNNELTVGGPGKNGADGKDGSIGVKGADGSTGVSLNGKDGSIGINGKDGANANITVENGKPGVDGADGTTKTRIVYETKDGPEEVATLNDGLKFVGDDNKVIAKKLNQTLNVTGGADLTKLADNNIGVVNTNDGLVVKLSKDVNLTETGSVTVGGTTVNKDGITINNGPQITNVNGDVKVGDKDGNAVKITNVKDGELSETSKDAVNGSQLYATNQNLTNLTNKVDGGFNITADVGQPDNVKLGETITYTSSDKNIVTTVSNNKIDFKLSDEAVTKFTKDHSAKVEAADNTITVNATETKTIDGVITTIYKVAVNPNALPSQIEYFSVNSTVAENKLNDGAKGINSIAIGPNATSSDQGAIALGTNSNANGNAAAALGVNSKAEGTQATAVGSQANATANGATAIGRETTANAGDATAVGSNANATAEKATALGVGSKATEQAALAVGTNATASAQSALAVGTKAVADKQFAVAIGMGAQATLENSVALGSESTVKEATPTNEATVGSITYTGFAGVNQDKNYVVSVGSAGKERQIQNVAAGRITSDSTDAINGSQLYAVADTLVKTGFNITADHSGLDNGAKEDNVKLGETVKYTSTDKNVVTTVTNNTIDFGLSDNISVGGKPGKDGAPGKDGSVGVKGADGKDGVTIKPEAIVFHGVDGVNGKDGTDGKDGEASIKVEKGAKGLDGNDGKDGESKTRIVYEKPNGDKEEVATLNDGLKFGANDGKVHDAKLNTQVDIKGAKENTDWAKFDAGKNIMTQVVGNTITVALAKDLAGLDSATFGTEGDSTVINKDGVTIAKKDPNDATKSNVTLTEDGLSNGGNQITNVDSGLKGKDGQSVKLTEAAGDVLNNAVNVGDLKNTVTEVTTDAFGLKDENNKEFKQNLGTTAKIIGDGNVKTNVVEKDGGHALEVSLANNITVGKDGEPGKVGIAGKDGKDAIALDGKDGAITVGRPGKDGIDGDDGIDGTIGVNGKDGSAVVLNGKDGSIGLNGTNGKDGLTIKGTEGKPGLVGKDGLPGKDGVTRIQYQPTDGNGDPIGEPEQVATLNDGLHFKGDDATLVSKKLNETLEIIGGADKDKLTANNIGVNSKDGKLSVQLAKDLKDLNSATFKPQDGENGQEGEGPTTVVNNNGVTITPKDGTDGKAVKLTEDGLDNGGNQIVNVKSGIDGVNGQDGQPVKSVNDLTKEQLDKVGTNAANINDVRNATDGLINKGFNITADNKDLADGADKDNVKLGETVNYTSTDKNIVTTVRDNTIDFGLANNLTVGKDVKDGQPGEAGSIGVKGQDGKDGVSIKGDNGQDGTPGEATITVGRNGKDGENGQNGDNGIDGKVGVNGKDGSAVVLNGKDGSIGLNGKDGKDGLTFKSADGAQGVDGTNGKDGLPGKDGKTRIVYQPTDKDGNPIKDDEGNPITEEVATLNDGLIFAGNNDKLNRHKLNSVVNIVGEVAQGINDKLSSENFKSAAGNINVVANEKDQLEIQLNRDLKDLATANFVEYKEDGSVNADAPKTVVNNNGLTVTPKDGKDGKDGNVVSLTKDGLNNGGNQIVNVKSGIDGLAGKDGINGKDGKPITSVNDLTDDQLKEVGTNAANINDVVNASNDIIEKGFSIAADNGETDHVKLGETVKYTSKDKNIITTVSDNVIDFTLNNDLTIGGPGKDGQPGKDGSIGVKGADGTAGVTLNGKDGSIGLTGPKGADGKDGASATISVKDGAKGLDGNDGKDGESKTRIVYEKPDGTTEEVATLNDGLRFVGDDGKVIDKKLNETLQISGGDTDLDDLSDDNIGVVNKDGKLVVKLAKNIDLTDEGSITIGDTFIDTNVVGVGDSALTGDSLTVGGDNAITVDGNKGTIGGLTNKTFDPNNFTSGQAATEDQLKQVYDVANSGWDIAANGKNSTNVGPKGKVSFNNEDGNIIITKETTDNNVTFALNNDLTIGGPGKNGQPGKDGAIGVKGADGKTGVALNGKDGTIGINGKDGSNGTMTFEQGKPGVDGKDGETKTRIVYETKDKDGNPVKEEVATLNDGLKFVGDDGKVITKKLNETLSITGGEKDATKLSDANNIGVVNNNGTLTVKLAKDIDLTKDGSVTIGDTTVNNDGLTIKDGPSVTKNGINAGDKKITNVKDGEISSTSKDAVNGSQLYQVQQVANAGWNLTANGKDKGNVKPGATVDLNNKDGNIVITKEGNNVTFGLNNNLTIGGKDGKDGQIGVAGKDGKDGVTIKGDGTILAGRDGKDGVDGSIGAAGKDGASAVLNGKDGSIGLTGPKGADGKPGASANIKVQDGAEGVDGTNGKDGLPGENGKTRIVYETKDKDGKPVTEQVATLNDGLIFSGNNEDVKNRQKLNTEVKVKGEGVDKAASENFKSASGNINVKANGTDTLEVQLAKAIDLTEDGSVTTGNTTVNNNGLTIKDGPSVTKSGIDAKGTKITNVKDGDVTATSKDAVNGSQLYNAVQNLNLGWELTVNGEAESQRINNNGKVNIKAGRNIEVSRKGSTVEIATSSNPEFDTVKVGGTTLSSTVAKDGVNELNVAGKDGSATRITNVAPGVKGTDAVNVNQLRSVANHVNNVDKDLRAGVAGALAAGNLYHVTQPGKSMVSAGVGTYRGQGALAVGYSRLSDNGKVGIKFSVNSNSRGHAGAAASVGYQW